MGYTALITGASAGLGWMTRIPNPLAAFRER